MFIPVEIHLIIASYISDPIDLIRYSAISKATQHINIDILNSNQCAPIISQGFIGSNIMKKCRVLNLTGNTNITDLHSLKNLQVLYCDYSKISSRSIKGLPITTLFARNNSLVNRLYELPKLEYVHFSRDIKRETPCERICHGILGITVTMIIICFVLFLICSIVLTIVIFANYMPQKYIQDTYIEATAVLGSVDLRHRYNCRVNCNDTNIQYLEDTCAGILMTGHSGNCHRPSCAIFKINDDNNITSCSALSYEVCDITCNGHYFDVTNNMYFTAEKRSIHVSTYDTCQDTLEICSVGTVKNITIYYNRENSGQYVYDKRVNNDTISFMATLGYMFMAVIAALIILTTIMIILIYKLCCNSRQNKNSMVIKNLSMNSLI